jgi:hypothetical protein
LGKTDCRIAPRPWGLTVRVAVEDLVCPDRLAARAVIAVLVCLGLLAVRDVIVGPAGSEVLVGSVGRVW